MAHPRPSPVKWWPCLDKSTLTVTVHTECGNCGATLMGPYCFDCGQHRHESARSVSALFEDAWHVATHVDGRFWQTLYILLFKPGKLTKEYFAERRARYLPPVRLYLVLSVLFFARGLATVPLTKCRRRRQNRGSPSSISPIATISMPRLPGCKILCVSPVCAIGMTLYSVWYVYRAMRVYYGQGRLLTFAKLCVVSFTYLIGFSLTMAVTGLLSMIIA